MARSSPAATAGFTPDPETLAKVGPLVEGEVRAWLERVCAPL